MKPCPRCLKLARKEVIHAEMLQPLPEKCPPLAVDQSGPCCHDCASADTLVKFEVVPTWEMARVAVGNDRAEQLRLPGPMGLLVRAGIMRPSASGDLEKHYAWLDANEWFGLVDERIGVNRDIGKPAPCWLCKDPGMLIVQDGQVRGACIRHGG